MKRSSLGQLELVFGSEFPTERAPEQVAAAARAAAAAAALQEASQDPIWCDSEAPTGVAVERPILPRPPRAPSV